MVIFQDLSHWTRFLLFCLFVSYFKQLQKAPHLQTIYLNGNNCLWALPQYAGYRNKNLTRGKDLLQANLWVFVGNEKLGNVLILILGFFVVWYRFYVILDANGLLTTITRSWRKRRDIGHVDNSPEDQCMCSDIIWSQENRQEWVNGFGWK